MKRFRVVRFVFYKVMTLPQAGMGVSDQDCMSHFMALNRYFPVGCLSHVSQQTKNLFAIYFFDTNNAHVFTLNCFKVCGIGSQTRPGELKGVYSNGSTGGYVLLNSLEISVFLSKSQPMPVVEKPKFAFAVSTVDFIPSSARPVLAPVVAKPILKRDETFLGPSGESLFAMTDQGFTSKLQVKFDVFSIARSDNDLLELLYGKQIETKGVSLDEVTKQCSIALYRFGRANFFNRTDSRVVSVSRELAQHHYMAAASVDAREGVIGSFTQQRIFLMLPELVKSKMRYEVVVCGFSVDMVYENKMIIEVDGKTHQTPDQLEKDRKRDEALRRYGYDVMRIQLTMQYRMQDYVNMITSRVSGSRLAEQAKLVSSVIKPHVLVKPIQATDQWLKTFLMKARKMAGVGKETTPLNIQICKLLVNQEWFLSIKIALISEKGGAQKFYNPESKEVSEMMSLTKGLMGINGVDTTSPFTMVTPFLDAQRWLGNSKRGIRLLFSESQMEMLPIETRLDMGTIEERTDVDISDYSHIQDYLEDKKSTS